jgi:hypothetical protein
MRLARRGNVEQFRAYIASDAFLLAFNGLDPERRRSAMRAFAKAETLCEERAPHPLATPKGIDVARAEKVRWNDPVMVANLADAYARAGGDDEKAARILGVTVGSARLARRRHLDAGAETSHRQNAVAVQGRHSVSKSRLYSERASSAPLFRDPGSSFTRECHGGDPISAQQAKP